MWAWDWLAQNLLNRLVAWLNSYSYYILELEIGIHYQLRRVLWDESCFAVVRPTGRLHHKHDVIIVLLIVHDVRSYQVLYRWSLLLVWQQDPLSVRLRRATGFRQPPVTRLQRKSAGCQETFHCYQGTYRPDCTDVYVASSMPSIHTEALQMFVSYETTETIQSLCETPLHFLNLLPAPYFKCVSRPSRGFPNFLGNPLMDMDF